MGLLETPGGACKVSALYEPSSETAVFSLSSQLFCKDGKFLMAGETFHWPALKKTLTEVSLKGAKEFYEGQTAKLLEADIRRAGRQ